LDDGVCAVDSSFEFLVEECVSVDATTLKDQLNIYPNPASDWIHIDGLKDEMEISILNLQGQIIDQFTSNSISNKFHIVNLSSGIYFLQWSDDKELKTKKFIINR
jgi:hypothetical protein